MQDSTDDHSTFKEHLPHLRKLLSNNSNQEARSWIAQVKFESQGFKDSAKFFTPAYADFNPMVGVEQHRIWRRENPNANPPIRAGFIARPVPGRQPAFVESDVIFADRLKRYHSDVQTHSNLRYAMICKMPDHIAAFMKDEANQNTVINVQDICAYIIQTYDATSGVSTQDTWSEQYAKLRNKNRKNASSFTEFFNEQQRLAKIYNDLTATYESAEVRSYREKDLLERTMQLYRKNLPIHDASSDTTDRFLRFKQDINVTHGHPPYATIDALNQALRASYQIWVNDVKYDQPKDDSPNPKKDKGKRKRQGNDEGEKEKPDKEKKSSCPIHPNGRHSANECRDLKAFYDSRKDKLKDKSPPNDKKAPAKGNPKATTDFKKTRFDVNSVSFSVCEICKAAGRKYDNHHGFNCHFGADKKCDECHIVNNHLASCSKARKEREDFSKIFESSTIEADHVTIPSTSAQEQDKLPSEETDWMTIDEIFGNEIIVGTQASQVETQVKSSHNNLDEQELLDFSGDDFEDAINDASIESNKNQNSNYIFNFAFPKSLTSNDKNIIYANTVKTAINDSLENENESGSYKNIGIVDSGCSNHVTNDISLIIPESISNDIPSSVVHVANGTTENITGKGTMIIRMSDNRIMKFEDTLIVPGLNKTLISPQHLFSRFKAKMEFDAKTCIFKGDTNVNMGYLKNGLYHVRNYDKMITASNVKIWNVPITQRQYDYLHIILGHPGTYILNKLLTKGLVITGIEKYDLFVQNLEKNKSNEKDISPEIECSHIKIRKCLICDVSKSKKHPLYKTKHSPSSLNEKIGTDLTGPLRTQGLGHERYMMIIIDYYSKFLEIFCITNKSLWPEVLMAALKKRVNKHEKRIKSIRTDNAELQSNKSISWLKDEGIAMEYIPPGGDHSEMGGGYERYFYTISTMVTASLLQANLPPTFWSISAYHQAKLKNIWYNMTLDKSPFIVENNRKPDISQLHPFGCFVVYKNSNENKIQPDGDPGLYVGNKATNIYLVYNLKTKKIDQSAHVRFYNDFFPGTKTSNITDLNKLMKNDSSSLTDEEKEEIFNLFKDMLDTSTEKKEEERPVIGKNSLRSMKGEEKEKPITKEIEVEESEDDDFDIILNPYDEDEDDNNEKIVAAYVYPEEEKPLLEQKLLVSDMPPPPKSMREALSRPDAERWQKANNKEKDAFIDKWKVGIPIGKNDIIPGEHVIPTKLVFAYKDHEGLLKDYKVRIVGRGDLMRKGEYEETFSPVVRIKTQRILIALATAKNMNLKQFDCDNAYLQGKTRRRIVIKLPEGWDLKTPEGEITRTAIADKALYGLKESGRDWYITIRDDFLNDGYEMLNADPCVFKKVLPTKDLSIISIYVDDGLQICRNETAMEEEFERINKRIKTREYRPSDYILSISTERVEGGIILHQSSYAKTILEEVGLWDNDTKSKVSPTPMSVSFQRDENSPRLDKANHTKYRSIVMKLSYLAQQTRADIMYAVNVLAQYQEKPTENEWKALIKILRYLKGTWDYGLFYRKSGNKNFHAWTNEEIFPFSDKPEGYADASFGSEENRKSRSGYLFFMSGAVVTWCSKKQPVISVSSTEAELYALSEIVREGIWIRMLLKELQEELKDPTVINQDNKSTIAIAKNPIHHQRVKHIEVKMNHLRQYLDNKDLVLKWCPTEEMIADVLTKALPAKQHQKFTKLMGYVCVSDMRKRST